MLNREEIEKRCIEIHGDKYDLSNIEYKGYDEYIFPVCKTHGSFKITPHNLLNKNHPCGCPKCGNLKKGKSKKLTNNEFLERTNTIHNNKYEYLDEYVNERTKIRIKCPIHGIFNKTPLSHIHLKQGCPECSKIENTNKRRKDIDEYLKQIREKHNNFYIYNRDIILEQYKNNKSYINVICPIHGEFSIKALNHLQGQGCKECGKLKTKPKLTKEEIIKRCIDKHNDEYEYIDVVNGKIIAKCKKHGIFEQNAQNHYDRGSGCPECAKEKYHQSETKLYNILKNTFNNTEIIHIFKNKEILGNQEIDIYFPEYRIGIEYQGEQHFKPIEHWGGNKKYEYTIQLDELKKKKCKNNNIELLYFTYFKDVNNNVICNENELINRINTIIEKRKREEI